MLKELLTEKSIRRLGFGGSYDKGADAVRAKAVVLGKVDDESIQGTVGAAERFPVRIWSAGERVQWSCTCADGQEGNFCAHAVAVGLAWLESATTATGKVEKKKPDEVRAFLESQEKYQLVDLMLSLAEEDKVIRKALKARAALNKQSRKFNATTAKAALSSAIRSFRSLKHRDIPKYIVAITKVVRDLESILDFGNAEPMRGVLEHGLLELDEKVRSTWDYGEEPEVDPCFAALYGLHQRACELVPPDPVPFAEHLFALSEESQFRILTDAAITYAHLLGEDGLAVYRRLVDTAIAAFAAKYPIGERRRIPMWTDSPWYHINSLLEAALTAQNDVDGLIAFHAEDLSDPTSYLRIAEVCRKAGRDEELLAWLMKGRAAARRGDDELPAALTEELLRRNEPQKALEFAWADFQADSRLAVYRRLKTIAEAAGVWPERKLLALAHLRSAAENAHGSGKSSMTARYAADAQLIATLLYEEEDEQAWDLVTSGDFHDVLVLTVARRRAVENPEDVVVVYKDIVWRRLEMRDRTAYEEAVVVLTELKQIMERLGGSAEFGKFVGSILTRYSARPMLRELLYEARLG